MNKKFKYENLDEMLEEFYELDVDDNFLLEETEDHQIWLDGPFIRILDLDVDVYMGQYLVHREDDIYEADFEIYVFMKLGTREVVYDEGYSSLQSAIHNYCNLIGEKTDLEKMYLELVLV